MVARLVARAVVLSSALAFAACRPASPAGRYHKQGLSFEHLAGWTVTSDVQKSAHTVSLEGPRNAVLTISVFPPELDVSLERFVDAMNNARGAGVKKTLTVAGLSLGAETAVESPRPIERSIAGVKARGLEEHFDIKFMNTTVPHTAEFMVITLGDRALILMDQVPDTHRAAVTPGLEQIFRSLTLAR